MPAAPSTPSDPLRRAPTRCIVESIPSSLPSQSSSSSVARRVPRLPSPPPGFRRLIGSSKRPMRRLCGSPETGSRMRNTFACRRIPFGIDSTRIPERLIGGRALPRSMKPPAPVRFTKCSGLWHMWEAGEDWRGSPLVLPPDSLSLGHRPCRVDPPVGLERHSVCTMEDSLASPEDFSEQLSVSSPTTITVWSTKGPSINTSCDN